MLITKKKYSHQTVLEREGWVLADERQPGIYVRSPEAEASSPLDWGSEPVELKQEIGESLNEIKAKYRIGDTCSLDATV